MCRDTTHVGVRKGGKCNEEVNEEDDCVVLVVSIFGLLIWRCLLHDPSLEDHGASYCCKLVLGNTQQSD